MVNLKEDFFYIVKKSNTGWIRFRVDQMLASIIVKRMA